jgi:Zn-dependent peptidase ImmA (M78 family)
MSGHAQLARRALKAALDIRRRGKAPRLLPFCVFDVAEQLGVQVMFRPEKSLEGMYFREEPPRIFVSAVRPAGRQRFTCAHELGHHVFGHGTRVDELVEDRASEGPKSDDERLADVFAGYLLMPLAVVRGAFTARGLVPSTATPEQFFGVACHLGVSYDSLVSHLNLSLGLITSQQADALRRASPKDIRSTLVPGIEAKVLVVVDTAWQGRPVDIQVGDHLLGPAGARIEGDCVRVLPQVSPGLLAWGVAPGLSRIEVPGTEWAAFVRVSRREYTGRSMFRHLRDPDADRHSAATR